MEGQLEKVGYDLGGQIKAGGIVADVEEGQQQGHHHIAQPGLLIEGRGEADGIEQAGGDDGADRHTAQEAHDGIIVDHIAGKQQDLSLGPVIFVSHDKHFIKNLATKILYVTEEGPEFFQGGYDYFEYKLEEKEAQWEIKRKEEKAKEKVVEEKKSGQLSHEEMKAKRNRIRNLEREIEKINAQMEASEKKLSELSTEMEKPEVYSNAAKITKVMKEKEALEAAMEELEMTWLEKNELLEAENAAL
ncbi:MAG: hypothetical protein II339_04985 [Spirochaetales bacterium]|nr:hypothetical protein [Spirochaetales bacterium]